MSSALTDRWRPPLFFSRIGARIALAHALAVVLAFALAGYVAEVSLNRIAQTAMRDRIRGEAASLLDEFGQKGSAHLPYTVAKRQRLWRGFDYRIDDAGGHFLAGKLPSLKAGWSIATLGKGGPGGGQGARRFLAFTQRLPDGAVLSVGQDMAVEAGQGAAIAWTLAACGALGVIFCVGLSYLASRGDWRRIAAIADVADAVSDGDLKVRAAARPSARDDIDQLGLAFNAMLDRIGALIGQVRQVSTDIAHDMRTPLTRHRQRLERLRAHVRNQPDLLAEVRGLEGDVEEILRTFDALLQLSEIEAGGEGINANFEDLAEIACRVAEAYRPDIEESGRRLTVLAAPAPIWADEALLAQAVANLLENALRHTPRGAAIEVAVSLDAGGAALTVRDDGPGIPAAQREAALRPFVRLEPSRSAPGSGLGLSIVAAVAQRHGARLELTDAEPGLRVRLCFPLVSMAPGAGGLPQRGHVLAL